MKTKDERVLQLSNKIQSEAYFLILVLSAISFFIKCYVMDMPFLQYAFELGTIIISTAYVAIRGMLVGYDFVDTSKNGKLSTAISILFVSLIISIINGVRNYSLYGDKYTSIFDKYFIAVIVITFISAAIFISIVAFFLYWFNAKGQQRIDKKLNNDNERD